VLFGVLSALKKDNIIFQVIDSFDVKYSEIYKHQGIIFIGETPLSDLQKAQSYEIPFVECGHPLEPDNFYSIRFDVENGIRQLLEYAVSCGHSKIGLVVGSFREQNYIEDIIKRSYQNTLGCNEKLIFQVEYNNLFTIQTALNRLLKNKATAVLCGDDFLAYLALKVLKKLKIKVPNDISIMGFDGIDIPVYLENPNPYLTTVYANRRNLGEKSVDLLKKLVVNIESISKENILPVTLRVGDSVKRL
jgi:DNA-binding LacI/PurR family transcriptional regulator